MKPTPSRATLRGCLAALSLTVAALLGAAPALAQDPIPPPKHSAVDANGVDLISGSMSVTSGLNSIGPNGPGGLVASKTLRPDFSISSMFSYVKLTGSAEVQEMTLVAFMGRSQQFINNPNIGPEFSEGNTLDKDATHIVYTLADGTVARFALTELQYVMNPNMRPSWGLLQSVTYPSGEVLTFTYNSQTIGASWMQVESSLGYAITGTGGMHEWNAEAAANLTQGGCSGAVCSGPTFASQEALGRAPGKSTSGAIVTINNPAGGSKTYTYEYSQQRADIIVTSVTDGVDTWSYSYGQEQNQTFRPDDYILVTTVTDPLGNKRVVKSRQSTQNILSDKVGIKPDNTGGQTTTFQYTYDSTVTGYGALYQITAPEGNRVHYVYDGQFNVKAKWSLPKGTLPGVDPETVSVPGATVVRASYNTALCASIIKVCNRPDWIKDERGAQTDFTYDPTHGGVLTATQPAGPNGVRPQTRFTYGQFTARYISGGAWVVGPSVWRLTQTSTCATLASCAGTADEVVTSYAYEPSTVVNNVRLLSTTTRAGDSSLSATTTYAYNARGDVTATDGPLPGTADTTRTYYDASRWKVGQIGPDPDGAGSLLYRAARTTYAADGLATSTETGTATNQSDTAMSSFVALQQSLPIYDYARRKALDRLVVGGVTQTLTQYSYDAAGRLICTAVRMAPTATPPTSACTPTLGGADGDDRVTYTAYDNADRVIQLTSGYGSATAGGAPRVEKTVTYTANGQEQTVADGKGNLTSYEYDGLDRLVKVRYPNTVCCASSTADFEAYDYDASNNRTKWWRRHEAAPVIFTYDALNRVQNGLRGEAYGYDNLGRRTSASYAGGVASASYDALGRMTSETTSNLTMTYQYDLAGNRIRMAWPDGFAVTYGRDAASEITSVTAYETPSAPVTLATYAYDDLGRPTTLARGSSGLTTRYGYDAASRLNCLSHTVVCTDPARTWAFAYNAAGQVKSRTASSNLYEWGAVQATKTYTVNGLNQVATVVSGTTDTVSYDLRGNMSVQGGVTYGYDLLNNLTSTSAGATLAYEPTGRLWQLTANGTTTSFLYSGSDLVAEYANGAVLRRYVPGPGTDAPLVWYEGSGFGTRLYLLADPQGSIVSVNNAAGGVMTTYSYDEYGIPGGGNLGRFRYTGQIWLPEIGLYHYKARAYSPTLGRFLQTDPIGYGDGLNWYAYVGNDPLNGSDSTGTTDDDNTVSEVALSFVRGNCNRNCLEGLVGRASDSLQQAATDYFTPSNGPGCGAAVVGGAAIGGSAGAVGGAVVGGVGGAVAGGGVLSLGTGAAGAAGGANLGGQLGTGLGAVGGWLTSPSCHSSTASGDGSGGGRVTNPGKQNSSVWQRLKNYRNGIKTDGKNYYTWDHTHNDIEVFNGRGQHLGSMNPSSGQMYKPAVGGRVLGGL